MRRSKVGRFFLHILISIVFLIGVFVVIAKMSGHQAPIDIVAETQKLHGLPLESQMVETNGIRLHVVLAGPKDGSPVLLLHGYPEFWWAWNEQIVLLARAGFRVIAPDQRGYNASDKPEGIEAYRVETLQADILGLMTSLGYEKVYVAGHDWGGTIAWRLVINHPERFLKLVMFNSPHPLAWGDAQKSAGGEETINWFRTFFQLPYIPELVGRVGNWHLLVSNLRNTSRPGTFSDADMELYRYAWDRDDAAHYMVNWYRAGFRYPFTVEGDGMVKVPTRIVWGMKDKFFESRMARFSADHCADATVFEIPDATHWLLHEEPKVTSNHMIEFFHEPVAVAGLRP